MHIVLFRKRNEKYAFKGQRTLDHSLPALDEGHWAVVRGPFANGKGLRTVERNPPTVDRGPRTASTERSNKFIGLRSKEQGSWTKCQEMWTSDLQNKKFITSALPLMISFAR